MWGQKEEQVSINLGQSSVSLHVIWFNSLPKARMSCVASLTRLSTSLLGHFQGWWAHCLLASILLWLHHSNCGMSFLIKAQNFIYMTAIHALTWSLWSHKNTSAPFFYYLTICKRWRCLKIFKTQNLPRDKKTNKQTSPKFIGVRIQGGKRYGAHQEPRISFSDHPTPGKVHRPRYHYPTTFQAMSCCLCRTTKS